MKALVGLLRKEIYHILRDRRTLVVLILLPIVQVILFGYSIRTDVKDVTIAFVDPTPDAMTLAIRDGFNATDTFRPVAVQPTSDALQPLFERNEVQVAIEFEPAFAEHARSYGGAERSIITDATEPNSGTGRLAYVNAVIQQYIAASRLNAGAVRIQPQLSTLTS